MCLLVFMKRLICQICSRCQMYLHICTYCIADEPNKSMWTNYVIQVYVKKDGLKHYIFKNLTKTDFLTKTSSSNVLGFRASFQHIIIYLSGIKKVMEIHENGVWWQGTLPIYRDRKYENAIFAWYFTLSTRCLVNLNLPCRAMICTGKIIIELVVFSAKSNKSIICLFSSKIYKTGYLYWENLHYA